MSQRPDNDYSGESRLPLDDAQFAIVALAITSFTLIAFVLVITLWMT
ncbi:hypothetical protein [Erwinia typographi]|nr:hypothetical protein [Erwinia typographi]